MNKLTRIMVSVLIIALTFGSIACNDGGETPTPEKALEETGTPLDINLDTPIPDPTSPTPEIINEGSAEFEVSSMIVTPTEVTAGESVTVTADVENIGEIEGTYIANLQENGEAIESKEMHIEAGASKTITFTYKTMTAGTHTLDLDGWSASFDVLKPMELEIISLVVTPELVLPGKEAIVEAAVKNVGEVDGTATATLIVNGVETDMQPVTLAPGDSDTISFTLTRDLPGTYDLSIGDVTAILTVTETEEYHNETYNYTISYPTGWTISDSTAEMVTMAETDTAGISVQTEVLSTNLSLDEYVRDVTEHNEQLYDEIELLSQTEVFEEGTVIGYDIQNVLTLEGIQYRDRVVIIKRGRYFFSVDGFSSENVYELKQPLIDACLDSFAHPEVAVKSYTNTTHGFSLALPTGWDGLNTGATTPLLVIKNRYEDSPIYTYTYVERLFETASAKEYASKQAASFESADSFTNFAIVSEGPIALGTDTEGYSVVFDYNMGDVPLRSSFTSVIRGSQVFSFFVQTHNLVYIRSQSTIDKLLKSFTLVEPTPFGVSRQNSLFYWAGDILTLDPAKAEDGPGGIAGAIFSGLVRTGKDFDVIPDIAERWEVSEDGTVYTFYLKDGVTFHDGKQVNAQDFKYSWERACNPDTESRTAGTYLGDIVGAKEMLAGNATELSGVRVIDDLTLEVTIDGPKPYFLGKLAYVTSCVVDRANVERGINWTDTPNGTGPFKLKEWQKDELLILERNPDYYYAPIDIENVVYQIYAGRPMMMYEQGEIDITSVATYNMDRVLDTTDPLNQDLISASMIGMDYVGFNVTMPPFDDPNVRRAFALALDMDKIIEVSMKGRAERSAGYVPVGMDGHNPELELFPFDPDLAKQLIAESKYGSVDNLPPITFYAVYGLGPSEEAMIGMWQENLGVTVEAEAVEELEDWLERMYNREFQLFSSGWYPDYYDPQNYLEILFHSESELNHFAYSNPDVDAALEKAAIEQDEDARIAMYQEIEQQILVDLPAVPFYQNYTVHLLVKPYVEGYFIPLISMNFWEDLSIKPH